MAEPKKLTVRERIDILLDKGTFVEVDKFVKHHCTNFGMENKKVAGDGVVCGYGKIDGRVVFVYASTSLCSAFTLGSMLQDGQGQDLPSKTCQSSVQRLWWRSIRKASSHSQLRHIFYRIPGRCCPSIQCIMWSCAGGSCYSPALTDFILMVREEAQMFITGPNVVKQVTQEECDKETLGGADVHSTKSGVCQFVCDSDEECLMTIRELIGFLPNNNMEDAPIHPVTDEISRECHELEGIVPSDPNIPYNIKDIIEPICDHQYFFEIAPNFAKNIVVGFGRMAGRTVGFIANQPQVLAGSLDIDASEKGARFVRFSTVQYPIVL